MGDFYRKHSRVCFGRQLYAMLGFERLSCLSDWHISQPSVELVYALKELVEAKITVSLCLRDSLVPPDQPSRYLFCCLNVRGDTSHV